MTITMYRGYTDDYIILTSKHEEFIREYGSKVNVYTNTGMYGVFSEIATWCNNEVGEECLFEMGE